jgi:hypothetical protein
MEITLPEYLLLCVGVLLCSVLLEIRQRKNLPDQIRMN